MQLGFTELLLITIVVLLVFGAGKLPNVMKDLGKGIRQFRDGLRNDNPPPPSSSS